MAIGDDALAAGYPLVPNTGSAGLVKDGATEINRTRDFIAQVKKLSPAIQPVNAGGTGATDAKGARTNLNIRSGTAAPSDSVGGAIDGNLYFKIL
jgi:hypothetical protein